ncbi:hypothetical protein PG997_001492 [Apiospora hydei]|uniref:Uncharacterized protein n=1 Tax=Apiospora hydei TaxID=1337664 RepID=A0ABR1XDU8_9PEZI
MSIATRTILETLGHDRDSFDPPTGPVYSANDKPAISPSQVPTNRPAHAAAHGAIHGWLNALPSSFVDVPAETDTANQYEYSNQLLALIRHSRKIVPLGNLFTLDSKLQDVPWDNMKMQMLSNLDHLPPLIMALQAISMPLLDTMTFYFL